MLPIWKVLADTVLPDEDKKSTGTKKEQAHVVRLQLDSGERVVGLSLQHDDVSRVWFTAFVCSVAVHPLVTSNVVKFMPGMVVLAPLLVCICINTSAVKPQSSGLQPRMSFAM